MHADHPPFRTNVPFPAERRGHLDRYPGGHLGGEHAFFVSRVLLLEDLPRWHADDACLDAFRLKLFVSIHAKRNLASGADENHISSTTRSIGQNVGSFRHSRSGSILRAVQRRYSLPRNYNGYGLMPQPHDDLPSFRDFVGIAGPQYDQIRHGTQRRQLFDRLMSRTVFAQADRVVSKNKD